MKKPKYVMALDTTQGRYVVFSFDKKGNRITDRDFATAREALDHWTLLTKGNLPQGRPIQ